MEEQWTKGSCKVAAHVRRGDVSVPGQTGPIYVTPDGKEMKPQENGRAVAIENYKFCLDEIVSVRPDLRSRLQVLVMTDSTDLGERAVMQNKLGYQAAFVKYVPVATENISIGEREVAMEADLLHMVSSDILLHVHSSFSYLPVFLKEHGVSLRVPARFIKSCVPRWESLATILDAICRE